MRKRLFECTLIRNLNNIAGKEKARKDRAHRKKQNTELYTIVTVSYFFLFFIKQKKGKNKDVNISRSTSKKLHSH